jgi:DNA-nicking Smr family endonuclease
MRKNKHNLPIFDSDQDLLKAFQASSDHEQKFSIFPAKKQVQHKKQEINEVNQQEEEDFASLLEESFKKNAIKPLKKSGVVPLKKRLKRYPQPEAVLDLHGYNAVNARMRSESFVYTCKMQGFFTVRIIVGKGMHSEIGPVLPDVVEDVLNEMKRKNLVLDFEWDKKNKSQSGSVIIYLQQFERYD